MTQPHSSIDYSIAFHHTSTGHWAQQVHEPVSFATHSAPITTPGDAYGIAERSPDTLRHVWSAGEFGG